MTKINGVQYTYGNFSGKVLQCENGNYFLYRSNNKGQTFEGISVGQSEAIAARMYLQNRELTEFGEFFG